MATKIFPFFLSILRQITTFRPHLTLPNDKILDLSNLKAFTYDKINVTENVKFVVERVENIAGKGENAGYQHFLLFPLFSKGSFFKVVTSQDCVGKC